MIYLICLVIAFILLSALGYYTCISEEKKIYQPEGENTVHLSYGTTSFELCGPHDAPVIVLLHGGTIPMCIWDDQVKEFTEAGFRILRYDQYGRGGSQRLSIPYTRKIYSEQLKELLDTLNIKQPVHLLGPSFGGAISVCFASQYPELVKSMVLISPVLNLPHSDSPISKITRLCAIPVIGDFFFRTVIKKLIIKRGLKLTNCPKCKKSFTNQFSIKGTEKGILSAFRSDAYGDYRKESLIAGEKIRNIALYRGDNDQDVTNQMIQKARTWFPHCTLTELKTVGHSPFSSENNQAFTRSLINFFKECDDKADFAKKTTTN